MTILVSDLVKGQEVETSYGMRGTVVSKAKGIRIMLKIASQFGTDIGDVYVWQVAAAKDDDGIWRKASLTDKQRKQHEKVRKQAGQLGFMVD